MRVIITIYTILCLIGCTSFQAAAPNQYKTDDYFYIQPEWLEINRAELTDQLVQAIRENNPQTMSWFPLVTISTIDIETQAHKWRNSPELKRQLNKILQDALNQVYHSSDRQVELGLALKIRTASTEINPAFYVLMVPYAVACLGTLMMLCPVAGKQIVVTEGSFLKDGSEVLKLSSAGAATLVAISPYAGSDPEWGYEATIKALIASLSQLTDKLVAHVEKSGI